MIANQSYSGVAYFPTGMDTLDILHVWSKVIGRMAIDGVRNDILT